MYTLHPHAAMLGIKQESDPTAHSIVQCICPDKCWSQWSGPESGVASLLSCSFGMFS